MGETAFPYQAVRGLPAESILGNNTITVGPSKSLTPSQVRALLGVYNTSEIGTLLSGKSNVGHVHAAGDITTGTFDIARIPIGSSASTVCVGNDVRLSDARTPLAHSHVPGDITGFAEAVDDEVSTLIVAGTGISVVYDDLANTLTIANSGMLSLNGLTDATQTFAVGTSGTNVAFSSAAGVHTLNIPDASVTARGVVTTGTQTIAGNKTFNGDCFFGTTTSYQIQGNQSRGGIHNSLGFVTGTEFGGYKWTNGHMYATVDLSLERDAAGRMGQRRTTNPQAFGVYNTWTSATSFERLDISWASNVCYIGTEKGSAGGTARDLTFGTDGAVRLVLPAATTSGAFYLGPRADNTATGGNARGANAVDLSTTRSAATQVASGSKSFAGPAGGTASGTSSSVFGPNCTASGTAAGAGGEVSSATGQSSFAWGQGVTAAGYGAAAFGEDTTTALASGFASGKASSAHSASTRAHAAAHFANRGTGNIRGSSQMIDWTAAASAAPGVETQVFSTAAGSPSLIATVSVPDNTVQSGVISIQAVNSSGNSVCHFLRQYAVKRIAGTVSEVYAPVIIGTDSNAAGASIAITADNTAKTIKVTFTAPVATASVTGDAGTDVITSAGHGFTDGQEIAFSNLVGGTGLTNNTLYFVRDATANTFKVTTAFPTNTATNFTTNITSGNVGYMWNVNAAFRMEEVRRGG